MSGDPSPGPRRKLLLRFAVLLGAPPAVLTTEPRERRGPFWLPVLLRAAMLFVPVAVATTAGFLLVGAILTADAFRTAFSPQALTAQDVAARLDAGAAPASVVPLYTADLATSRYQYVMVLDRTGRPLASSALLDGRPAALPAGVVEYARTGVQHEDQTWALASPGVEPWVVWTPRPGVSSAIAVAAWQGGYVVAGRSVDSPGGEIVAAWALTLTAAAAACLVIGVVHPMPPRPAPPGGGGGGDDPVPGPVSPPAPHARRPHGFRPLRAPRARSRPRTRA